jgi:hypothetical protein
VSDIFLLFLCSFLATYHIKIIQDNTAFENLDVGFNLKAIEDSLQFPRAQVQAIMGTVKLRLEPSAVDEFIAKLYHLFEEIRKTGKI